MKTQETLAYCYLFAVSFVCHRATSDVLFLALIRLSCKPSLVLTTAH